SSLLHHRYLHSFPTRRSSDLTKNNSLIECNYPISESHCSSIYIFFITFLINVIKASLDFAATAITSSWLKGSSKIPHAIFVKHRSEEHTSELQSRFDLVCCLL